MKSESNSTRVWRVLSRFQEAPLELRVFAIFSLLVAFLGFVLPIFGSKDLKEALVPITGWSPSMGYMFGLYFTFALIFMKLPPRDSRPLFLPGVWKPPVWNVINWLRRRTCNLTRFGIIAPLVIQMLDGLWTVMRYDGIDYGNPYLKVSPWQPLWTVGVPALWILILFSPRMNRFCHRPAELSGDLTEPCAT